MATVHIMSCTRNTDKGTASSVTNYSTLRDDPRRCPSLCFQVMFYMIVFVNRIASTVGLCSRSFVVQKALFPPSPSLSWTSSMLFIVHCLSIFAWASRLHLRFLSDRPSNFQSLDIWRIVFPLVPYLPIFFSNYIDRFRNYAIWYAGL